ncbi:MAG: NAD(P)/FAD-dependent oxidoreductase [Chitinivibrionales bacterium]|nr:NAD(P)/FAD-dependent oxidoreductase [Chitinivibrionales bacterium]
MTSQSYTYCIVGAGLAGASAAKAVREIDPGGSIVLIGEEAHPPYHRPPLSKDLWMGEKQERDIFVNDVSWYEDNTIDLLLKTRVEAVDASAGAVTTDSGKSIGYEKLLLATGGRPGTIPVPGGDDESIFYFRTLEDYRKLSATIHKGQKALVIGGGFIGSEMAAALHTQELSVTMIFPEKHICGMIFPLDLARDIHREYEEKGIAIRAGDTPESIEHVDGSYRVRTNSGTQIECDIIVAGIGIMPRLELAESAGIERDDGIIVNEYLQSSNPAIYAAGDNASFPYAALGARARFEHWDCAASQGATAGKNMAGAQESYRYLPYFFSDLFDFGYEAVGLTSSRMSAVEDWEGDKKGAIYYRDDGRIRGVMTCNKFGKLDRARTLIEQTGSTKDEELKGYI